ncbi:HAD family hydrolase [Comamonas jiangduensis]|uniref:HAD family hydrolase n=1 Tax=Comamonas jiangduensis TaxID=1194168 RepID=UPI0024E0EC5F|nr:HAD family phosphatase [Comamonas jiangduensis]
MQFEAILFDCDGVLVDSELITNRVLHGMLNESGWVLSEDDCMRIFIGKTVRSETARIETETGQPLTDAWMAEFYERRNARLRAELVAIEGALDAVQTVHHQLNGKIAVASGADKPKVIMQLEKVGMLPFFGAHVFSGHDLPRTKPWPDVYLAAAASLDIAPQRCLVIEDSVPGLTAGVRAGATVWGYCPPINAHSTPEQLLQAGATHVFDDMADLPRLLAQANQ